MISIQSISNSRAEWLASKIPNDRYPTKEDQIEVYTYVIGGVLGETSNIILLISLALILGVLTNAIFITLTFTSLRVIAGGYHFKTHLRCATISLIQFIGCALVVQYTHQYWTYVNIYCLLIFSIFMALYIIIRYIPRDTPNKPITEQIQINKFKRWSLFYISGWIVTMSIFLLLNIKIIVIASCFGLLLELFSISELGYQSFYARLDK